MDPIQASFLRYGFGLLFLIPFFIRVTGADLRAMQGLGRGAALRWEPSPFPPRTPKVTRTRLEVQRLGTCV